jgi:low temperature requirement protein LtrA
VAADELAHYLAEGHLGAAIGGFCLSVFAVSWAWMNYSWFASAYDNDDWVFRVATMVQMVGVIVLALGIEDMFASIDRGGLLDVRMMVFGYVVMRVSMIFLWSLVARQDPARAPVARIGSVFLRQRDPFHLLLLAGTAVVLVLAPVCAQLGMNGSWCLVVLMFAPVVTVLG